MAIKRVLLDACVPHRLRSVLLSFEVQTAHFAGLERLDDAALLAAIEGRFDVLVTLDKGLLLQQKIAGRAFGVVVMRVPVQTPDIMMTLSSALIGAINLVVAGQARVVMQTPGMPGNWTHTSDLA